ncbi:MAG TPA: PQQ-dependent sugar dehydrogenase [Anseongella sp.]|nr:PQQ-dependent sugar dehydrogenase [Anseongella sp.]
MKKPRVFFCLLVLAAALQPACNSAQTPDLPELPELRMEIVTEEVVSPVAMGVPGDGTGRLFICEQRGLIKIISGGELLETPFLDLREKMVSMNDSYTERGLLGLAFHPGFQSNRKFYVYYSAPSSAPGSDHKSVLSEFTASAANPDLADTQERILLEIEQPQSNHNGGQLAFGPDGYLYIGTGDGGGAGDRHGETGNGQDLGTLLGKILRIDVNKTPGYAVPEDNPFAGREGARPEIWAYGLRNPWRFSFDRENGRLFAGDVGQNSYEEVDIITKGGNYGWRVMEGAHCYDPGENCGTEGLVPPIDEYGRDVGISITGGYVYRGQAIPELKGRYVFADWTGPLFALSESNGKFTRDNLRPSGKPANIRILSFGEDSEGELYVLTSQGSTPVDPSGAVYKLVK